MTVAELRSRLHRERGALPHCVYRAYDEKGTLLYVGCTYDFAARRKQHGRKSAWSQNATRWSVRWHPNRSAALAAEHLAIITEDPRFNVSYEDRARRSAMTADRQRAIERDRNRSELARIMSSLRPGRHS